MASPVSFAAVKSAAQMVRQLSVIDAAVPLVMADWLDKTLSALLPSALVIVGWPSIASL